MPTLQDCDDTRTDFRDLEAQLTARRYSKRKKTFTNVAHNAVHNSQIYVCIPHSSTEILTWPVHYIGRHTLQHTWS